MEIMPLPTNISFGTVTGRFMRAVADSNDPDRDPDGIPIAGLVIRFTPSVQMFKNITDVGGPVTIVADPIAATTNSEGKVIGPDGAEGIRLIATNDTDLIPSGWTWGVSISGANIPAITFSMPVAANSTIDLTTVVPVPPNPGQDISDWERVVLEAEAARDEAEVFASQAVAVQDTAVSTLLIGPSASRNELNKSRNTTLDTDYGSIDAALAATPAGGTLEVRGSHARTTTFLVNKPCTLRFAPGGQLTTTNPNLHVMTVTANDVTIESPKIVGAGWDVKGVGKGIRADGAFTTDNIMGERIKRLKITNPRITGISYMAIAVEWAEDVRITDGEIYDCAYSGITLMSVNRGRVMGVDIHDIRQHTYINSYGVAVTNWNEFRAPSSDVIVSGNFFTNIPWEGLDTHGGSDLLFQGNTFENCGNAIAVVGGPGGVGPKNIHVINNDMNNSTRSGGIVFVGEDTEGPGTSSPATGVIIGNTIRNSGDDRQMLGGIVLYNTRDVAITSNVIENPNVNGIVLNYNNQDVNVACNTILDVASATSLTSAIVVGQDGNSGTIALNTLTRGARAGVRVNEYGLRFHGLATPASFRISANKFDAPIPILDVAGAIIRPAVTGSRGGSAALANLLSALDSDYVIKNSTTA